MSNLSVWQVSWLVFVNSTQAGVIWEEEILTEKMPPSHWHLRKSVWHFILSMTVSGTISRKGVLIVFKNKLSS